MVKNERTGKEEKKFEEWQIGCITGEEDEQIRKILYKKSSSARKKNICINQKQI